MGHTVDFGPVPSRERSPLVGVDLARWAQREPLLAATFGPIVREIREQKAAGTRPSPSAMLVCPQSSIEADIRDALIDRVAALSTRTWSAATRCACSSRISWHEPFRLWDARLSPTWAK